MPKTVVVKPKRLRPLGFYCCPFIFSSLYDGTDDFSLQVLTHSSLVLPISSPVNLFVCVCVCFTGQGGQASGLQGRHHRQPGSEYRGGEEGTVESRGQRKHLRR